jgi:hypothetical protein
MPLIRTFIERYETLLGLMRDFRIKINFEPDILFLKKGNVSFYQNELYMFKKFYELNPCATKEIFGMSSFNTSVFINFEIPIIFVRYIARSYFLRWTLKRCKRRSSGAKIRHEIDRRTLNCVLLFSPVFY